MRKKILMAAVAAMLIAVMLCGSALAASAGAKVLTSTMKVYSSVDDNGKVVDTLRRGTSVKVMSISEGTAHISYNGKTGYAPLKNIVFDKHIKAVTTTSTPIRFVTKKSYKKGTYYTGTLKAGVTLYVAGIRDDYYLIYNEAGSALGYVAKSAVKKAK